MSLTAAPHVHYLVVVVRTGSGSNQSSLTSRQIYANVNQQIQIKTFNSNSYCFTYHFLNNYLAKPDINTAVLKVYVVKYLWYSPLGCPAFKYALKKTRQSQ